MSFFRRFSELAPVASCRETGFGHPRRARIAAATWAQLQSEVVWHVLDGPRYASLLEVNRWDMGLVEMGNGGLTLEAGCSCASCYSGATATSKSMRGLWRGAHGRQCRFWLWARSKRGYRDGRNGLVGGSLSGRAHVPEAPPAGGPTRRG